MRALRGLAIMYLSFELWLMLFPPWIDSNWAQQIYPDSAVTHRLGHHWRFSAPLHWAWLEETRKSFLEPDLVARIDYRLMLYESVLGLAVSMFIVIVLDMLNRSRKTRSRADLQV